MTTFRLIPLPFRPALQMLVGLFALVTPFAIGFTVAGALVTVVLATLLIGLAFAGIVDEQGTTQLPVAVLFELDQIAALALFLSAAVLALAGDLFAGVTLVVLGAAQLALTVTTRYSLRA